MWLELAGRELERRENRTIPHAFREQRGSSVRTHPARSTTPTG